MVKNINSVVVDGNITKDCEYKNGICSFSIAVSSFKKCKDGYMEFSNFFDCVIFGKFAEAMKDYLKKGIQVAVQGSLHQERWEDKEGNKRSKVVIYADNIHLASNKSDKSSSGKTESYDEPPF